MSARKQTESFIYDIIKLAIVEELFRVVEFTLLGIIATAIVALLVIVRHRQRILHPHRRIS